MEPETSPQLEGRWRDLDRLLLRQGNVVGPGFEPGIEVREFLQNDCKILVIGAGGLGCELLKDLALSGFGHIDVIDMDTIDVSNLNRQFLFRTSDVGQPKATVAARKIMQRVKGVTVVPHYCRIEDKDTEFYRDFQIIVLGLDSLDARSYINSVVCGFLEFGPDGEVDQTTIKPMVDGGTEGFKGHARVILPGITPCFHCLLWLFPPQITYPLCTLAETPRSAPHCIEYVHLIQWGQDRPGLQFDADNADHMTWVYEQALKRAELFGISGVTHSLTQGVVKHIVPAIASTNAIIAAACALETLKMATMCSTGLDNFLLYEGSQGIYTNTISYSKDPECLVCSAGNQVETSTTTTLQEFIEQIIADPRFDGQLAKPSLSFEGSNLYMQAPPILEEMTRENLSKPLLALMNNESAGGVLNVNDKKLKSVLRLRVSFRDTMVEASGA
eukprot:TRINITY_DN2477_c0_g1_i1.p1 TRINITY_DN2477_c0_g1~~TRINITY_DN2477_c0_g1_i1.p1  ORF type:complete len:444 (-),score=58.52 TRINITY_DN2477_c0_g1_i1:452-1783(-)